MEKKDDERVLVKKSEMRNSSGRKYGVFVVTLTIWLKCVYISISTDWMKWGLSKVTFSNVLVSINVWKEVMAGCLVLYRSVCLSFSLPFPLVKLGPWRQWLPAAPSVAEKCPKFISEERQGRRKAKIHQESDTEGEKKASREKRAGAGRVTETELWSFLMKHLFQRNAEEL